VKPSDAIEDMLVVQMAWTHARLAKLSALAVDQTQVKNVQVVNDACNRAANTFRRQMLALSEYRRPPQLAGFVAIEQADVANQQVVQNVQAGRASENQKGLIASNEQGSAAPALPPVAERAEVPAGGGDEEQAVAAELRPQDGRREGAVEAERDEARERSAGSRAAWRELNAALRTLAQHDHARRDLLNTSLDDGGRVPDGIWVPRIAAELRLSHPSSE